MGIDFLLKWIRIFPSACATGWLTCDQALLFLLVLSSPSRTRRKRRAWSQVTGWWARSDCFCDTWRGFTFDFRRVSLRCIRTKHWCSVRMRRRSKRKRLSASDIQCNRLGSFTINYSAWKGPRNFRSVTMATKAVQATFRLGPQIIPSTWRGGGRGFPYISHMGMFHPIGYHFQGPTVFVLNRVYNFTCLGQVIPNDLLLPPQPYNCCLICVPCCTCVKRKLLYILIVLNTVMLGPVSNRVQNYSTFSQ